jgi:DNA mismatch repair protein MutS
MDKLSRNVILTGPNAGGKSTFLKGLALNIILAQTIGIVPARHMSLTPFNSINTYLNIPDDTAGGKSLFKAEVLRAQQLLMNTKALKNNQFGFSIMDEMFSGTSPKEGEAASYAVAKKFGELPNNILLLATHFPKLTQLENATNNFKNYKVCVTFDDQGNIVYPYKLEAGIADQNVAINILKEEGFDTSILDDAHELLQQKV